MNAMKASIGQLKYRHIFKLMFSCFNLMQCLFYVYSLKLVAITDGNLCSPQSGFSGDRIL